MGMVVVKVHQDANDEAYVIWKTNPNLPLYTFRTRQELRDHLFAELAQQSPLVPIMPDSRFSPDARIQRANETGSSDPTLQYGFDDKEWPIPVVGGWCRLKRDDVWDYAVGYLVDPDSVRHLLRWAP